MKQCLIYLDAIQIQNSLDLLEVARQIYGDEPYEVCGLAVNMDISVASDLFDFVISVTDPKVSDCNMKVLTDIMANLHQSYDFDSILIPATWAGRMLAPRLAMRLHVGLTADVTEIRTREDGTLLMVRPAFSGRILAGIVKTSDGPVMMSIRQNVFVDERKEHRSTTVIQYQHEHTAECGIRVIAVNEKPESYDIRDSEILISGGGGVMRSFDRLEALAKVLDGQVSASRKIVDKGLASRSIQVGQSGKTVSPKLYIALGIYGAIQHVEGLKNVEHIISVNTNRSAPICSLSDIVVEDDATKFIDLLVAKINETRV